MMTVRLSRFFVIHFLLQVLIFSTLVMTLDLIEEYMIMRGYAYRRLDGRTSLQMREKSVHEFNSDTQILAFILSTRAGGLGLNLVGADTVIFFNRDWVRNYFIFYILITISVIS